LEAQPLFEPEIFGRYFLVDKIATGGMASIYRAKVFSHGGFEQIVAVKRILPHLTDDDGFVRMFVDEAKVSARLQHPNIVRVMDFGRHGDHYFIEMELVEGKDLRSVLKTRRREPLDPALAVFIIMEAARGLAYAHGRADIDGRPLGIVHRDVSPANILVSYDGFVKVTDFGIAKAASNQTKTEAGALKGKFQYMSPEQASGKPIDRRSDVFSLGTVLYELLCGRRAFSGGSHVGTLRKVMEGEVTPLRERMDSIPADLEAIVEKAMSPDPEDRYATAQEMHAALAGWERHNADGLASDPRAALATFMNGLFGDDIVKEKRTLQQGSRAASRMRDQAVTEGTWDASTQTLALRPPWYRRKSALAGLGGAAALLLLLIGLNFALSGSDEPGAGVLSIQSDAPVRVYVDDVFRGEGTRVFINELEEGTHAVRLVADGHLAVEEAVQITAEETLEFQRALTLDPAQQPPLVRMETEPVGAEVFVNGRSIGTAPVAWREGRAGEVYSVQARLAGYDAAELQLKDLAKGSEQTVQLKLRKRAARSPSAISRNSSAQKASGLTVTLSGASWADVYIDGHKLPRRAPFKDLPVAAGEHKVRVVNDVLGIDTEQTVTIGRGKSATVRARAR